jgi:hypothetical protein
MLAEQATVGGRGWDLVWEKLEWRVEGLVRGCCCAEL